MKKQKRAIKQKLLVSETCKLELKGMCESGESWAEVPELFCQVLEEDDSVKQCALLKKAAGILLQFTDHDKQGIPHEDYCKFLAFLAEVFVACNVKNPSRRIVASIFNSSPRFEYSFDVLCSVVFKKLSSTMEMMEVGKEVFARSDIDMIVDILELFTLGTDVLRCNGHFGNEKQLYKMYSYSSWLDSDGYHL